MKNIKEISLAVATFLVVFSLLFFFLVKKEFNTQRIEVKTSIANSEINGKNNVTSVDDMAGSVAKIEERRDYGIDAYVIEKGWIKWQEPKDVGDLGLTSSIIYKGCKSGECNLNEYTISNGIRYVKVGDFLEGKFKGGELFDVYSNANDDGGPFGGEFFRLIKVGDEFVFPSRMTASYNIDQENSTEYFESILKSIFTHKKLTIDKNVVIDELILPEKIIGKSDRQVLKKVEGDNLFFTNEKLKLAFTHPVYGEMWVTDENKSLEKSTFELNSYTSIYDGIKYYEDSFSRDGFYIKLADSSTAIYKMSLDIFDKEDRVGKLMATWNDGTINDVEYEEFPSGCGMGSYIYNRTLNVNKDDDLVVIGRTQQGDELYGFKSTNTEEFKKLYNDIYWVKDGKKKSSEDFIKLNPEVFWIDSFGRIVAFFRTDIISPAECGKPVIYLYPQSPMNINVKVEPGNGLSITEPNYEIDGWNVFSDTRSNIKNLADGKTYPYLFWEGMGAIHYETPKQGFVVAKDSLNLFFDDKLKQLGLIEKEIKDFKEFWIPEMNGLDKPYYFVTFLSNNFMDKLAPLTITPKPDTIIRVMMDYQGLDRYKNVSEFKIKTPVRNGFTAVEWGGMLK